MKKTSVRRKKDSQNTSVNVLRRRKVSDTKWQPLSSNLRLSVMNMLNDATAELFGRGEHYDDLLQSLQQR